MVQLILSSLKGNQGLRYFPHSGYLGLTPVTVEGVVRTKRDDDPRQLLASSITISVRCYESRIGRVSILQSNVLADYTTLLWSKPEGQEYSALDEVEFPFRITVPVNVPGFSTAVFVDYRCMWRVEAILNHAPISVIGSRQIRHFELSLVRFDVPPCPLPLGPSKALFEHQTSKPKAPRIRYSVHAPTWPIGPLDIVSVPISLLPLEDDCIIRSASLVVERHIQLNDFTPPTSSPHSPYPIPPRSSSSPTSSSSSSPSHPRSNAFPPSFQEPSPPTFSPAASVASDISSDPTITPHSIYPSTNSIISDFRPLLPSGDSSVPSKLIVNPVVAVDSSPQFSRSSQGSWVKTITFQWPAVKSHSRWTVGETIQSDLVSVKFFVRVKISVSSANGTESIELSEKELLIVSTNEAERQLALAKYNDLLSSFHSSGTGRSKSKSPRRVRRDRETDIPPSPAPFQGPAKFPSPSTGSADELSTEQSNLNPKVARSRRPHTSAGPRDKPYYFAGPGMPSEHVDSREHSSRQRRNNGQNGKVDHPARTGASQGEPSKRRSGMVSSIFSSSPRITTTPSGSSSSGMTTTSSSNSDYLTRTTSSSVSSSGSSALDERNDKMKEWEQELAKIEMLSRKTSDMLGFSWMRKRFTGGQSQRA